MVLPEDGGQNGSASESTSKRGAKREREEKNIKKLKIYSDVLSAVLGPAVTGGSRGNSYGWNGGPNHFSSWGTQLLAVSLHMILTFTISPSLSKVISSGINSVFPAV